MEKIIIFTGTLSFGGSERVISILTHSLSKYYSVEVVLFYNKPVWYEMNKKVKIILLDDLIEGNSSLSKKVLYFRRYIKQENPLTVISFLAPFNMFAVLSLLFTNIPTIVAERNDPRHIPKKKNLRLLRNLVYSFSRLIIVQTENNKNYFSKKLRKKSYIIYNPISSNSLTNNNQTKKEKKIVSVGRLIDQKNHALLINAFYEVKKEFPEYTLIIYGEGEKREELLRLIEDLGLRNCVELPGVKKNVKKLISDSEMFVLTSNFEGMPNALIEAMCIGLPCISTKVSGAVDLIEHKKNGILVNVGNKNELVREMKLLLRNNEYANLIGNNAREISKVLNEEKVIEDWMQVIQKVKSK